MEAATTAINNFLSKAGEKDTTVDQTVAPAVEHETITKQHEEEVTKVVEKEKHQDHYQTIEQPLQVTEVEPTEHKFEKAATKVVDVEHDDNQAQAQAEKLQSQYKNTTEEGATIVTKGEDETVTGEHVHHHLHQTIQPVIEKETIERTKVHKVEPVKERHHLESVNHGVIRKEPISVDEFQHNLNGETAKSKAVVSGEVDRVLE